MFWLLGGYMFLFVYRPWEVFPIISSFQIERFYMLAVLAYWFVWPCKVLRPNRVHFAIMSFAAAMVASWIISPYRDLTWPIVEDVLKIIVFYILLVTTIRSETDLRKLVWFFVIAVGLYAGHSGYEYLCGRYEFRQGFKRMIGVDLSSRQSNMFAGVIVTSLPFVHICWNHTRSLLIRLGLIGYVGMIGVCVALTGSRGGYVTLAVFALAQAWLSKHRKMALGLLFGLFVLINIAMPGMVFERIMTIIDPNAGPQNAHDSAMGRVAGLMAGLNVWSQNPVLGAGPMSFMLASGLGFQAHNLVGQLTGDLGTGGLLTFSSILICCYINFRQVRKLTRNRPEWRDGIAYMVVRATLLILFLHLIYGLAGHNLYRFQWYWAAGFNAGATYCLLRKAELAAQTLSAARMSHRRAPQRRDQGRRKLLASAENATR